MKTEIHRIFSPMSNSYLIRERGTVLVDAGSPFMIKKFLRRFRVLSIEP
jgi:flavorubredoxin